MRELTGHIVNPANDKLTVQVLDEPGAGGANYRYKILGYHDLRNPSRDPYRQADTSVELLFQNGPIAEVGVNGVSQEVLLEIVADRLRSFQAGPFNCSENGVALAHVEAAQKALLDRTRARMSRGVEGKNVA